MYAITSPMLSNQIIRTYENLSNAEKAICDLNESLGKEHKLTVVEDNTVYAVVYHNNIFSEYLTEAEAKAEVSVKSAEGYDEYEVKKLVVSETAMSDYEDNEPVDDDEFDF